MLFPVSNILERLLCSNTESVDFFRGIKKDYLLGVSWYLTASAQSDISLPLFLLLCSLPSSFSPSPSLLPSLPPPFPPPPLPSLPLVQSVLRTLLVVLTGLVVLAIPKFSTLMALVGSSCCTLLAFILPGLFHWLIFRERG